MNTTLRTICIVAISFLAYHILFRYFGETKSALDTITRFGLLSYCITYALIGVPVFIGTYFIKTKAGIFSELGLSGNAGKALLLALLFSLPMFIGGFFFFDFNAKQEIQQLIASTFVAGFVEELYFRGFLFGVLYRHSRLGFIPAIILGAVIFASGHLYQSQDAGELVGIFMITFSGACLFAWLYSEWNYNLWVPVFLHSLMNLSWSLFEMDHSALGNVPANVLRGCTIALAIVFTILYKRHTHQKLTINRNTIFIKKENDALAEYTTAGLQD
ncbi:CPBP family intramembrane metalloprotease [Dyadobacter luteus]|uniref:CPBP family intramembrane metalloprotease n=1 Tax=Dyadobacter luteus TaxID=2259619 RepID=A0A3D8Y6K0_9BACT|nr:CPBP family intramembrane glutamic endopeptidase [Dyadobacter luteus]REA58509.1 CPBP family intramembrane metalloprotease [Dyadobacter luteus]